MGTNIYSHSSESKKYENNKYKAYQQSYYNYLKKDIQENKMKHPGALLLDSSLISQTKFKTYNYKVIKCGDYYQVYNYKKSKQKIDKNKEKFRDKEYNVELFKTDIEWDIDIDYLFTKENLVKKKEPNVIEYKNIMRSKFSLQRLVKSNEKEFKTFITLTFSENVIDIVDANKSFNSFKTYIKRLKNDFKYICVPEFQKRGAVHYHLLTNIDYTDFSLLSKEEKKIYNKKSGWQVGRNVIGWNKGFSLVKTLEGVNVVGYITKYMTKDIDNRLFGKRRYLNSQNLIKPTISYLDYTDDNDFLYLVELKANYKTVYSNTYYDINGDLIDFEEFKIKEILQ